MSFDYQLMSHISGIENFEAKSILLERRYLFKLVDSSDQTLLHLSAKYGNAEICRFLIQCGTPVNAQDIYGVTPLMLAVSDGNDDATVEVLLNAKADIYLRDNRRSSSLRKVIKMSHTWFERLKADSFKETKHYRILKLFLSEVEKEFAHSRELMAEILREAHCPLALVIFMNNVAVTKYLLDSGYPLNEHFRYWSALHIAVLLSDFANVALLVEFGADVNDQDNQRQTPLFLYDRSEKDYDEQLKILNFLLNNGALLFIPRSDGVTLMEYFFTGGKKNTLMALMQRNTDELTKRTVDGKTPLHFLVRNGNHGIYAVIELLLRKNIDIDAADNEGRTALVIAVNACLLTKIYFLIALGAKVNFIDIFDKTFLFDALIDTKGYYGKYKKVVDLLLNRKNSTSDNQSAMTVLFELNVDPFYKLAKLILKHLVLAEANGASMSVNALAKIESRIEFKRYYQVCTFKLQEWKTTMIYESITLYKLLTESDEKLTLYARNKTFIQKYEKFMHNKSPNNFLYFDILRNRIENAIELAALRREASRFICDTIQLLPDPRHYIYYQMVKYLSKQDLYNICN